MRIDFSRSILEAVRRVSLNNMYTSYYSYSMEDFLLATEHVQWNILHKNTIQQQG